jgi:glucosamine-6-phosphate deaminase
MEVVIQADCAAASYLVARLIAKAIRAKPDLVLGLAAGQTMKTVYPLLVEMHQKEGLDFSRCKSFNLDDYIGLPPEDENSFHYYMKAQLFNHINLKPENTHFPNGMAADLPAECERYETAIRAAGGIDLQLLGIGQDGHIGFNEPLSAMLSRTRIKALSPITIAQNGALFGDPKRMPRRAITMGVGTILDSKHCLLLATGPSKAEIVAKAVEGPITAMVTASALQLHTHCTIVVDRAAATRLQGTEHYRWIFNNEPEWAEFR